MESSIDTLDVGLEMSELLREFTTRFYYALPLNRFQGYSNSSQNALQYPWTILSFYFFFLNVRLLSEFIDFSRRN